MTERTYTEAEVCTLMRRAWMAGASTMLNKHVRADDSTPDYRSVFEARNADVKRLFSEGQDEFK